MFVFFPAGHLCSIVYIHVLFWTSTSCVLIVCMQYLIMNVSTSNRSGMQSLCVFSIYSKGTCSPVVIYIYIYMFSFFLMIYELMVICNIICVSFCYLILLIELWFGYRKDEMRYLSEQEEGPWGRKSNMSITLADWSKIECISQGRRMRYEQHIQSRKIYRHM